MISEGSYLHRIKNPRKDFFDLYSNEELGIEEESQDLEQAKDSDPDRSKKTNSSVEHAKTPALTTSDTQGGPLDQLDKYHCIRSEEATNRSPRPTERLGSMSNKSNRVCRPLSNHYPIDQREIISIPKRKNLKDDCGIAKVTGDDIASIKENPTLLLKEEQQLNDKT